MNSAFDYEQEIGCLTHVTLWRLRQCMSEQLVQEFLAWATREGISEHLWCKQYTYLQHDVRAWYKTRDPSVNVVDKHRVWPKIIGMPESNPDASPRGIESLQQAADDHTRDWRYAIGTPSIKGVQATQYHSMADIYRDICTELEQVGWTGCTVTGAQDFHYDTYKFEVRCGMVVPSICACHMVSSSRLRDWDICKGQTISWIIKDLQKALDSRRMSMLSGADRHRLEGLGKDLVADVSVVSQLERLGVLSPSEANDARDRTRRVLLTPDEAEDRALAASFMDRY